MGCVANITLDSFPKQGTWLGKRTEVVFHYDTRKSIMGTVVRDDREKPFRTIIKLDDGRYVEGTECQHSPQTQPEVKP